jgi:hypothetical protein
MDSPIFRINLKDIIKGLIVAVFAAVLTYIQNSLSDGIDWGMILQIAITTGLAYLSKNLLTDDSGKVLGKI